MSLISEKAQQQIQTWMDKFPEGKQQSALLAALNIVQEENGGYLTNEIMDALADFMKLPRISVYEVASFYTLFHLKPNGKHKLYLCTNISCQLRGAKDIAAHMKRKLGVEFGQTTKDGRFTLYEVECLGSCGGAPCMQVGRDYHENLTTQSIDQLLETLE